MREVEHRGKKSDGKEKEQAKKADQRMKRGTLKTLNDEGQIRKRHMGKDVTTKEVKL